MNLQSRMWAAAAAVVLAVPLAAAPSAAQGTATVRGTVTDSASRAPLAGVQVLVAGTSTGTTTGDDGQYLLRVQPGRVLLRVQRLGYAPAKRELTVAAGATVEQDFGLARVSTTLSEVVVVGYGTESRRNVTGAVATVTGTDVARQPVAGIDAALQGRAPGVQVTQNSGDPGIGISVRVRGAASLSASSQPLYVVDGIPVQTENFAQLSPNSMGLTAVTGLDPSNIESITVLKDAASAAIYGSRASNGVILITTRRGREGKAVFTLDAYMGSQTAARTLDLLDSRQYVEYMNESAVNDGEDAPFDPATATAVDTDWQDAVLRSAPVGNVHLGVSGGTDRLRYLVDGTYFDQQGIVLGSRYSRANARVNVDYDAGSRLSLSTSVGLSREDNRRIEGSSSLTGIVTNAIGEPPLYPVRNEDGTFTDPNMARQYIYANPVAIGTYNRLPTVTDRALGNVEADYRFDRRFTLTGRAGLDVLHLRENQWQSPLVIGTYASGARGKANSGTNAGIRYVLESFLTYGAGSDEASRLTVVGGGSVEYNHGESNFIRGEGFPSPAFHYIENATNIIDYDGLPIDHNLLSYFARANYSFQERYLLSASFRADGSSRFGPNNRWGYFPAVSAGWVVSNEPFMGDFEDRFGALKLRGSYGITGNQSIPNYATLTTYESANYGSEPGIAPTQFGNINLKWEQTKEWDVGLDWTPFGGRVSVIADYYQKNTSNLLVRRPIPATFGFTSYWDNIGSVLNRGVELGINTVNFQPGSPDGFSWTTDFNISSNHNEVTELYQGQPVPGNNYVNINQAAVGHPIGAFYVYHFEGVDPATGDAMYSDDRVYAGNPQPAYFGGLGNTLSWRGLQLRGFLTFSQGAKVFNLMRVYADDGGCAWDNKFTVVMNRWQKPGDITDQPRASYDCTSGADQVSDRYLEDGSYLRIQDVTLTWRLPRRLLSGIRVDDASIYVSGHNLYTFTDYIGYDPDVNSNGSSDEMDLSTDFYSYPRARTVSFGITTRW